jgi:hypothetical protein
MIVTTFLSRRGPMLFLPYMAIVFAGAIYLCLERVRPFARRLMLSAGSFMVATLILYLFIAVSHARAAPQITVLGHAWRLVLMLLIGGILACAVAQLTATDSVEAA